MQKELKRQKEMSLTSEVTETKKPPYNHCMVAFLSSIFCKFATYV